MKDGQPRSLAWTEEHGAERRRGDRWNDLPKRSLRSAGFFLEYRTDPNADQGSDPEQGPEMQPPPARPDGPKRHALAPDRSNMRRARSRRRSLRRHVGRVRLLLLSEEIGSPRVGDGPPVDGHDRPRRVSSYPSSRSVRPSGSRLILASPDATKRVADYAGDANDRAAQPGAPGRGSVRRQCAGSPDDLERSALHSSIVDSSVPGGMPSRRRLRPAAGESARRGHRSGTSRQRPLDEPRSAAARLRKDGGPRPRATLSASCDDRHRGRRAARTAGHGGNATPPWLLARCVCVRAGLLVSITLLAAPPAGMPPARPLVRR